MCFPYVTEYSLLAGLLFHGMADQHDRNIWEVFGVQGNTDVSDDTDKCS